MDELEVDGMWQFMRGGQTINLPIPSDSSLVVHIPSNKKGTGFVRKQYNRLKPYVGGLISSKDFKSAIDTAAVLTAKVYSHNRKKDVEGISNMQVLIMLFCCLLVVIYFIFMYYGILNDSYNMKLTAYFLLLISCFITIVNGVINFYQSPDKYTPFKDMVRKTLLAFFERLNKKYNDQGLSFIVHDNHYWIEIKIKKDVADKWRA